MIGGSQLSAFKKRVSADFSGFRRARSNSFLIALVCCLIMFWPQTLAAWVSCASNRESSAREITNMSVDVDIHLFNLKVYKEVVLPAYQAYFRKNNPDPLVALLNEICPKLEASPKLSKAVGCDRKECENYIRVLREGFYIYSDEANGIFQTIEVSKNDQPGFVETNVIPRVVAALCLPYDWDGIYPEQSLTDTALANYLYEKSELFQSFLTFTHKNRSDALQPSIGDTGEALTKKGVQELSEELSKIAAPTDPEMKKEYENFRSMIKVALEDPAFTLVLSTG